VRGIGGLVSLLWLLVIQQHVPAVVFLQLSVRNRDPVYGLLLVKVVILRHLQPLKGCKNFGVIPSHHLRIPVDGY